MKIKFRRFSSKARCPQKSTLGSAGHDLLSSRNVVLEPNSNQHIPIDIGFCFSSKYFAKIYSRSSLSLRSVEFGGGAINSDFRGNVNVILHNLSDKDVEFETDGRIAQVVFQKCKSPQLIEVSDFNDFITYRNDKGFASTEEREQNGKFCKQLHSWIYT